MITDSLPAWYKEEKNKSQFSVVDKIDVLQDKRLKPKIQQVEDDKLHSQTDEFKLLSIFRYLAKNNGQIRGMLKTFFNHVILLGQKPIFLSDNKTWNKAAERYFKRKSKSWEGKHHKSRFTCSKENFKCILREGCLLLFYDRYGIISEGKWFYFTRDKLTEIQSNDLKKYSDEITEILDLDIGEEIIQNKGILSNSMGITVGYVISKKTGAIRASWNPNGDKSECTIIPIKGNSIKLVSYEGDVNSKFGESELLVISNDANDGLKLFQSQVKKAGVQAKTAVALNVNNPIEKKIGRSGKKIEDALVRDPVLPMENIERLGEDDIYIEYLGRDESIQSINLSNGDAVEVKGLLQYVRTLGGYSMGLPRIYSTGDSSGSTFAGLMGELNIASNTFKEMQKWWEREVLDFEAEVVISDAIEKGLLPDNDDYDKVMWSGFPSVESLNPLQSVKSLKEKLRSGLVNPTELLGADWEEKLGSISEFVSKAKESGLIFDYFPQDPEEKINEEGNREENAV